MSSVGSESNFRGIAYGCVAAFCAAAYLTINRYVYLKYKPGAFDYTATFLLAAGVVAALSLGRTRIKKSSGLLLRQAGLLVVNGTLASIGLGLLAYGQNYTTAVNASIIFSATTIPTVVFSRFMLKDSLSRRQLSWMSVMFVGLYLAIVGTHLLSFNGGDLIILIATVFVGFTNAYSKILMRFSSSDVITDTRLITGGVLFAILGFAFHGGGFLVTSAGWWPWLSGFFLWMTIKSFYLAVEVINPNRAVVLVNSHPVITPFLGVLLLNEPYSWIKAVGSGILLVSVYNITKKESRA
jgi:drug/metabolite transporter (DMT)-like permease